MVTTKRKILVVAIKDLTIEKDWQGKMVIQWTSLEMVKWFHDT